MPYFIVKDMVLILLCFSVVTVLLVGGPNCFNDPDSFLKATPVFYLRALGVHNY